MQLSESPHHIPRFHLAQHKIKPKQTDEELITKMGRKKATGSGRVEPKRAFEWRFGLLLCWWREGQRMVVLGGVPEETGKEEEWEQIDQWSVVGLGWCVIIAARARVITEKS